MSDFLGPNSYSLGNNVVASTVAVDVRRPPPLRASLFESTAPSASVLPSAAQGSNSRSLSLSSSPLSSTAEEGRPLLLLAQFGRERRAEGSPGEKRSHYPCVCVSEREELGYFRRVHKGIPPARVPDRNCGGGTYLLTHVHAGFEHDRPWCAVINFAQMLKTLSADGR